MNKKERKIIDQALCRKVQVMLAGAKPNEVAMLLGIGESTVRRIQKAGFNSEEYLKNVERRRTESNKEETRKAFGLPEGTDMTKPISMDAEEQVPGQIRMELPAEMSDQTKMMRFQAGQVEKLYMMLSKINDSLCQILRRMDDGH